MESPLTSDSRPSQLSTNSWCHPANKVHRFLALVLMCFLCFGSYFCYDTPGALADNFKSNPLYDTSRIALLYAIYSWPNVILCFIGGFLIDRYFGIRLGTIIYMVIVTIGAIIFATGVYVNVYWLAVLGRFIFGIGGESLQVAVNSYVVLWFKGKELNMVFGLQLSFSRFGSAVNFWVMEPIYRWVANYYSGYETLGVALFIASFTCVGSLICGLLLGWMDHRAEKILGRREEQNSEEPFRLSDVFHFKPVFWLLSVICVAYYLAIFPFIALGKLFFERKFDLLPQDANVVNSMVYLLAAALSPLFGILIDKTGRNVTWVIISTITTIGAHFLLAFTFFNPYLGMITLGISYSLLASGLWPLVALIVAENQLGTAYGMFRLGKFHHIAEQRDIFRLTKRIVKQFYSLTLAVSNIMWQCVITGKCVAYHHAHDLCQAVQNFGLATVLILAGVIVDHYGYLMLEMFFLGCLFISLTAAVLIYIIDSSNNGLLNMSPSERESLTKRADNNDETANLLDHEDSSDQDITDSRGQTTPIQNEPPLVQRDLTLSQSDRIRSRYITQLLPNTNIPERQ